MARRQLLLLLAVPMIAVYPLLPDGSLWESGWFSLIGVSMAVAMVAGVHRRGIPGAWAWRLFALGIALNSLGTPAAVIISGGDAYPSAGDPFYLALYPALIVGLVLLIRARTSSSDWGALVDSTTVTTGLGLLTWVFVVRPLADDASLDMLARLVSIAYPVGDIVLLSMLVRLMLGSGARNPAFRLIGVSLTMFLAGDATWAVINELAIEPSAAGYAALAMWFLGAYVMLALASLHPSARDIAEQSVRADAGIKPIALVVLAGASLIAPALLALQVAHGEVTDGLAIAIGCATLFLLVVTRMGQLLRSIEAQARQLRDLATIDDLTGLPNRRGWSAALSASLEQARRSTEPLSVAMIDLDHFKRFNDELGHQAGDRLLRTGAAAWRGALRGVDQIARYGGEEFIVLLPQADGSDAEMVIERLRAITPAGQTFSAGVSTWDGIETPEELIARADRALYQAKAAGRDCTIIAEGAPA